MRLKLSNEIFFAEVERLLSEGESVTLTVRGNSMRPWLRDGKHKVVLYPCSDKELQVGDIALFRHNGSHILHRVAEMDGDKITFAGDGNIGLKELTTLNNVVALAKSIILPNGRVIVRGSREWRFKSRIWLAIPQIGRRIILSLLRRICRV